MEKWNDIVLSLLDCKNRNASENDYQEKVEEQFKFLGWSISGGCIESKPMLPIGNSNYIVPDVVLRRKSGERVVVVEVKEPNNSLKKRQELQLFSYMRQLELRVGLYIGEKIQLYYNAHDDNLNPHPILVSELVPDSINGQLLCDLLDYNKFDLKSLEEFCAAELNKIRYKENLRKALEYSFSEDIGTDFIRKLVKEYFLKDCPDETILDDELKKIKIQVEYTHSKKRKTVEKLPPRKYPKYSLNGGKYVTKRELVLDALRLYVNKHPDATYKEIEDFFNIKALPGGYKVVRKMTDIKVENEAGSLMGRFYTAPAQILISADGVEFAVSNQWDYNNFPIFVNIIKKLKWRVKEQ